MQDVSPDGQDVSPDGLLVLDGDLTVRNAATVCATLGETIARHAAVSIDCSQAAEVDLSFIQLLVAARASAGMAGKTVVLAAYPGGALLDTLIRGGFRVTNENAPDAPAYWFDGAVQ